MASRPWLAIALGIGLAIPLAAAEYQFEDNVRDLMASAKELMAKDELEEAALEYENVLAIDANHREAGLAAFEMYCKLGAVDAAEALMPRFARMGVDSAQQAAMRTKLDAVKTTPPPKRKRVFTAAVPAAAPAPAAPTAAAKPGADPLDDIGDLDAPAPAPSAAPQAAPPPAAGGKDDLDDLSL